MQATLRETETWIFDLDNTLYPAGTTIYPEVERRMNEYIMRALNLPLAEAQKLRRRFFLTHGTTLRGLMLDYGMPPGPFLDYCHDLDLAALPPDPRLAAAIAALPGRKLIFTNATTRHAERVLERLGMGGAFAHIHDIVACDYLPKPDPSGYHVLIARHALDARTCAMVEDLAKNLVPAAALGMTTIWVKGGPLADDAGARHIHYTVEDLADFLIAAAKG